MKVKYLFVVISIFETLQGLQGENIQKGNCSIVNFGRIQSDIEENGYNNFVKSYLDAEFIHFNGSLFSCKLSIKSCLSSVRLNITCTNCVLNPGDPIQMKHTDQISNEIVLNTTTTTVDISWKIINCSIGRNNISITLLKNESVIWKDFFLQV